MSDVTTTGNSATAYINLTEFCQRFSVLFVDSNCVISFPTLDYAEAAVGNAQTNANTAIRLYTGGGR